MRLTGQVVVDREAAAGHDLALPVAEGQAEPWPRLGVARLAEDGGLDLQGSIMPRMAAHYQPLGAHLFGGAVGGQGAAQQAAGPLQPGSAGSRGELLEVV